MPYTLLKFLLWFGLAALIGGAIGWLLRSLKCRSEIAEARASTVDDDDVERMRHRLANLEQVVTERDRLRMQVADLRAADSPGIVGAADAIENDGADEGDAAGEDVADSSNDEDGDADSNGESADEVASSIMPESAPEAGDDVSDATVAGIMSSADAADETGADEDSGKAGSDEAGSDEAGSDEAGSDEAGSGEDTDPDGSAVDAAELDLGAAARVLGKKIKLDDLTAVEGIGPKISELCRGIDVSTWRQLADTDVADLRSMLDAAGPRYQIHKPESWPRQAELLATGQWDAFRALTDELDGGR